MITETMSYAEIAREIENDIVNVERYQVHLPFKKYMREVMGRPNGIIFFKPVEWVSPNHNKFILTPCSFNKAETKKNGPSLLTCCVFMKKGELYMAIYSQAYLPWLHVQIFTPHFFQRYNERFLKEPAIQKMDLIKTFIQKELKKTTTKFVKHPKLGWEGFAIFTNGYSFSELADRDPYILHHTFVVDEMLHPDQLLNVIELKYEMMGDIESMTNVHFNKDFHLRRTQKLHEKISKFNVYKPAFLKSGLYFDEMQNLCFEIAIDVLDYVEYEENPILHKFGRQLLDISSKADTPEQLKKMMLDAKML